MGTSLVGSCMRKQRYGEKAAKAVAGRINAQKFDGKPVIEAYHCIYCFAWHVGKSEATHIAMRSPPE